MSEQLLVGEDGFALPMDYATHRIAVLAKPRVGKSNAGVRTAEELSRLGIPWVAIDPKGDWWGVRSRADGAGPGLAVPIFGGEHGDIPLDPGAGKVIGELIADKRLSCVIDLSDMPSRQAMWGFLIDLGETLLRKNRGALHLFLDECDEYLPQKISDRGNQPKALSTWSRVVSKGGQKGIGVTLISQRSAFVNKDVLWLVDAMIAFNTFSPKDRETIAEWLADKGADRREFEAGLRTLQKGQAWVFGPDWLNDAPQLVQYQRRTTFDSGATPEVGQSTIAPANLADVDLEALGAQMQAAVERQRADDPKALHARIAELERSQLAARDETVSVWATEATELRSQVLALTLRNEALSGLLARVPDELDSYGAEIGAGLQVRATAIRDELGKWCADRDTAATPAATEMGRGDTRAQGPSRAAVTPGIASSSGGHAPRPISTADESTLTTYQRDVLTAIVRFPGRPAAKVAVIAGKRPKSSTLRNNLSALRTRGLIEGGASSVTITPAGRAALGPLQELPSGAELVEHWQQELGANGCPAAVLGAAFRAYPQAIDKADIEQATGYSATSSTVRNALSTLRTRELIEDAEQSGYVRCASLFFEREAAA